MLSHIDNAKSLFPDDLRCIFSKAVCKLQLWLEKNSRNVPNFLFTGLQWCGVKFLHVMNITWNLQQI